MDNDFVGDDFKLETHVFKVRQVDIGMVYAKKLCPWVLMVKLMSLAVVRLAVGVLLLPG